MRYLLAAEYREWSGRREAPALRGVADWRWFPPPPRRSVLRRLRPAGRVRAGRDPLEHVTAATDRTTPMKLGETIEV